jgi:translation initiation factor IF-2
MSKLRIYTLAKELGLNNHEMLALLDQVGVEYKSPSSTLEEDVADTIRTLAAEARPGPERAGTPAPIPTPAAEQLPPRAPVVTILGHVDHGKTSLLDYIRKTKVAASEAGGITQHIGAFEALTSKGRLVFIDTPGHEAFTSIRARGANAADIAIIVVAADDGIMPQTREAVAHAQAAKIPILVAINKIDLEAADPERVKTGLTGLGLVPEEYGGDTIVVPISAKTGQGVPDLLEMISLVAELEQLRANPRASFQGIVLESRVDRQAGVLVTILTKEGTLKVGDVVVAGEHYGKIRAMTDSTGQRIKEAGPATPVQVLGFSDLPQAGEPAEVVSSEPAARQLTQERAQQRKEGQEIAPKRSLSLAEVMGSLENTRQLNLILRADTQGSLEALQAILERSCSNSVKVELMFAGIGAPNESDVLLASTAQATILAFAVNPPGTVKKIAEQKGIAIKSFRIIYELIDEVQRMVRGQTEPVREERYLGRAEVRALISVPRTGMVAGSYVLDGVMRRNARVRVLRGGKELFSGTLSSLKRFKDDAREVAAGYECGISLQGFDQIAVGDILEASEMVEIQSA